MLRDEYFRRLVDEAHIDLYLSANDGARLYWPWRMQPPKEATTGYRNACEQYIIDSDPEDDTVTTEDVLDCAYRLDAEVASLQDIYQDKDGTVDTLLKGLEIADDHPFDGQLLLPLQDPFVECYREIGEPSEHMVGIGGLKDSLPHRRLEAATNFRKHCGYDVWLHGFGWGVAGTLATEIRNKPDLLDSVDYSSPVQSADYTQGSPGAERASVTAMQAGAQLIKDLREVSSYPDSQEPADLRGEGQAGLDTVL